MLRWSQLAGLPRRCLAGQRQWIGEAMTDEEESRRIIRRLEEQSEKILGAPAAGAVPDDKIEALGKRIARIVAYALAAWLIYTLWQTYF